MPSGIRCVVLITLALAATGARRGGQKSEKPEEPGKLEVVKSPKSTFCRFGIDAVFGPKRVCCPAACGRCAEDDACRDASPGALACCPVSGILAVGRVCKRRRDVACFARAADDSFESPAGVAGAASTDGVLAAAEAHLRRFDDHPEEAGGFVERADAAGEASLHSVVHVALAGDRAAYFGLVTCVASIFASTRQPERVHVHAVVGTPLTELEREANAALHTALRCATGRHASRVSLVEFDARLHLKNITIHAPNGRGYGNLKSPLNFARFYLEKLLPREATKVVYLDADTVVLGDVVELGESALQGGRAAIAAAPRPAQSTCYSKNTSKPGMFYCDEPHVEAAMRSAGVWPPDEHLAAFNAGVAVFHLGRWREQKLTEAIEGWLRLHDTQALWRLGSNPPLVLAASGTYEPIDVRWNCDGLGWKKLVDLEPVCLKKGAFVWHWSGPRKPWLAIGLYKNLWWPHIDDARCLAALEHAPLPRPLPAHLALKSLQRQKTSRHHR